jgi:YD repeat-containing protein
LNLTHNEADWLIAESGPLGVARRFTYNPAGYLTISSERNADAAGMDLQPAWINTHYEWDAQGRCTRVTHPLILGRSASFTYEYDGVSNLATLLITAVAKSVPLRLAACSNMDRPTDLVGWSARVRR